MALSHDEASWLMQAAVDQRLDEDGIQRLQEHLHGCPACREQYGRLLELDTRLRDSLGRRWARREPAEKALTSLLAEIKRDEWRPKMKDGLSRLLPGAAWAALAVLVVALLAWSIRSLRAEPEVSSGSLAPLVETPAQPQELRPAASGTERAPQTTGTAPALAPVEGATGLFPNTEFTFAAPLPSTPGKLQLYRQKLAEPVTPQNAIQMASRLGVSGEVYRSSGEGGEEILDVTDGRRFVRFINTSGVFVYHDTQPESGGAAAGKTSRDALVQAAASYLQQAGLLDYPYHADDTSRRMNMVSLLPHLDGWPVIFGIGDEPGDGGWASLELDGNLLPTVLYYSRQDFEPLGVYPILTAAQAWERLSQAEPLQHLRYAVLGEEREPTYQDWLRRRPVGEFQHVYGYALRLEPAEAGGEALVTVNDLPLRGDTRGIEMGRLLHVWGNTEQDERGVVWLALQGWELSPLEDTNLTGTVLREGERVLMQSGPGTYLLPDAPADLLDGMKVEGWGVLPGGEPPVFDWRSLYTGVDGYSYGMSVTCGGGGGGGGGGEEDLKANFGGGSLAMTYLQSGEHPTPTALQSEFSLGQAVEGWAGMLSLTKLRSNGAVRLDANFFNLPGFEFEQGYPFTLTGEGLDGIEAYQNLPVRVWGQVSGFNQGVPVIQTVRFEPLYPGVKLQEFAGTQNEATIDGQPALLLTTQDGQQYLDEQSIGYGNDFRIGLPGDLIELEGYLVPDRTIGGYAVIRTISGGLPPDGVVSSSDVQEIDLDQSTGLDPLEAMRGRVTIHSVSLAYAAISLNRCPISAIDDEFLSKFLVVQPVWVFKGVFDDGRRVELQIQALPDVYLE